MTLHIQLLSTTVDLAVPLANSSLLCTGNAPGPPNLDFYPIVSSAAEAKDVLGLFQCPPDWCRTAIDVSASGAKFTATLIPPGKPCNVFGNDIQKLSLSVEYETGEFPSWGGFLNLTDAMSMYSGIHPCITDSSPWHNVPESVSPRPKGQHLSLFLTANIQFNYTASPFSFSICHTSTR